MEELRREIHAIFTLRIRHSVDAPRHRVGCWVQALREMVVDLVGERIQRRENGALAEPRVIHRRVLTFQASSDLP